MSVRRRILILQLCCFAVVVVLVGLAVVALRSADRFVERIDAVQRRLEVVADLAGQTGVYGERVAAVLLVGRSEMRGLDDARIELERGFARLSQVTREAFATISPGDVESELRELEATRRMVEVYHAIDLAATRALNLERDGQRAEALASFQRDVEFRLDNELRPLLAASIADEGAEAEGELAEIRSAQTTFLIAGASLAVLSLGAIVALGAWINRGVTASGVRSTAEIEARSQALQDANARLRNIDARRTQFLADVSHELRTPLTILRGEADVALRQAASPDQQRESLELIQSQAAGLGQLLDELIAFARSDAEAQDYVTETIALDRIVAAAVQEGEVLAETREVRLTLELHDSGVEVDADFRRLKQALVIGLDNAVKHSPPGARVEVSTALADQTVAIRIADEGPGLEGVEAERVFERFYRGRSRGDVAQEGLGIGLAIAKEIIDRHRGTITLRNRPGRGALLEITLPKAGSVR